jgi:hypothetical protein
MRQPITIDAHIAESRNIFAHLPYIFRLFALNVRIGLPQRE